MSVSKWKWTEACDSMPCCGNCDECGEETEDADNAKSCGNCVNCDKVSPDMWVCEEYGFFHAGVPVHCEPPYDGACTMWADDPKKKNTWEKYV